MCVCVTVLGKPACELWMTNMQSIVLGCLTVHQMVDTNNVLIFMGLKFRELTKKLEWYFLIFVGSKCCGSLTLEWHVVPRTHPFFLTRSHSWSVSGYKAWQISGLGDTRCKYLSVIDHTTSTCFNCTWVQRWILILCFFIHEN